MLLHQLDFGLWTLDGCHEPWGALTIHLFERHYNPTVQEKAECTQEVVHPEQIKRHEYFLIVRKCKPPVEYSVHQCVGGEG